MAIHNAYYVYDNSNNGNGESNDYNHCNTMETLMIRVMVAITMTYLVPGRFILDKLFWLGHSLEIFITIFLLKGGL